MVDKLDRRQLLLASTAALIPTPLYARWPTGSRFAGVRNAISSAGVFDASGALVRTLWSAVTNNSFVNNAAAFWDGTLDNGSVAPTGTYTVKVLQHNCTYTWEGVIGNSSPDHSPLPFVFFTSGQSPVSQQYHAYGGSMTDMCITAAGEMYFTTGYDERTHTFHVSTTANPQISNGVTQQTFRDSLNDHLLVCSDGTHTFFGYQTGSTIGIWACSTTTTSPVGKPGYSFPSGTPLIGINGATLNGAAVGTVGFPLGLAVQQTGNILFFARNDVVGAGGLPTYVIVACNKTSGATLKITTMPEPWQRRICVNPADDSLWVAHATSSAATNATWDVLDTNSSQIILSNGNLTASAIGLEQSFYTTSNGSGTKFYFELVINQDGGVNFSVPVGVVDIKGNSAFPGSTAHQAFFYGNGSALINNVNTGITTGVPFTTGDTVSIAVDLGAKKIWARSTQTGNQWLGNNSTNNPATGTGGYSISAMGSPGYASVAFANNGTNGQVTAHFASASWAFTAPSGFSQLPGVTLTPSVKKYTCDSLGNLTDTGIVASTGIQGIDLKPTISPDGTTLLVADNGTHQVRAFNTSDGSVKTAFGTSGVFGALGGSFTSPAVTNTTFFLQVVNGFAGDIFICYAPDGSWWLGDVGNCRAQHFSSGNSPSYIEQMAWIPGQTYSCGAFNNDPTRVFSEFLEFKIDYTKTLAPGNGSWTLVNNWAGSGNPEGTTSYFSNLRNVTVASNGRTYVPSWVNGKMYELTTSGWRNTGVLVVNGTFENARASYVDAGLNLWHTDGVGAGGGASATIYVNRLVGFDGSNNPIYTTNSSVFPTTVYLTTATLPANFPTFNSPGVTTAGGVIPAYDIDNNQPSNHFGGINSTTGAVTFSAHPVATKNYGNPNTWLKFAQPPVFPGPQLSGGRPDAGTGVINPGGTQQFVPGTPFVFTCYRGEDWGNNQTCMWSHWHESGLCLSNFGTAAPYFGSSTYLPTQKWAPLGNVGAAVTAANITTVIALPGGGREILPNPGMSFIGTAGLAGNVISAGSVFVNGSYYLYNNDEWYHAGLHRWRIDNASSLVISQQTVNWNSGSYVPPTPNPYDFLAGLPFDTTNIPLSSGGWMRSDADNTAGSYNSPPWHQMFTSTNIQDRGVSRDMVFEANNNNGHVYTTTYSWTRIGTGDWNISGVMTQRGQGSALHSFGIPIIEPAFTIGIFVDVLDNTGKKLMRIFNGNVQGGSGIGGDGTWINFDDAAHNLGLNLGVQDFNTGVAWSNYINGNQPFKIQGSIASGKLTITYGGFTVSNITPMDAGADITHPGRLMVSIICASGGGGGAYFGVNFTSLKFADS